MTQQIGSQASKYRVNANVGKENEICTLLKLTTIEALVCSKSFAISKLWRGDHGDATSKEQRTC